MSEPKPKTKEFMDSSKLFNSMDMKLAEDYVTWWASACDEFLNQYMEAKQDGEEDSLKLRMLASVRLAQLGLNMFQFFSSAVAVIADGKADEEACNAVTRVVSMLTEKKTDQWITEAKKSIS